MMTTRPPGDTDQQTTKRFYTVTEAAQLLRLSAPTLYREIRAGKFPAIRVRGSRQRQSIPWNKQRSVASWTRTILANSRRTELASPNHNRTAPATDLHQTGPAQLGQFLMRRTGAPSRWATQDWAA
jgi:excisionase family DNA binding protein